MHGIITPYKGDHLKSLTFTLLVFIAANLSSTNLSATTIDTSQQPTIGSPQASVQVVAFLEPKCPDSKRYNNTSFPKLQAEFINTNKIRYSVITTSFLNQSMPAAIGLLAVYNQTPNPPHSELFFKYLDYIYLNQPPERQNWATLDTILKFAASTSDAIDQKQLKEAIETGRYKDQVEKNTDLGNRLMGHLSTPTIYVNGIKVENSDDTIDYEKLKSAIQNALN